MALVNKAIIVIKAEHSTRNITQQQRPLVTALGVVGAFLNYMKGVKCMRGDPGRRVEVLATGERRLRRKYVQAPAGRMVVQINQSRE
jgi:hypothetical protein